MRVAVIGAGNIGGTLGGKWTAAGHHVVYGVRDPSAPKSRVLEEQLQGHARLGTVAEALAHGEAILLSTPWSAVEGILTQHSAALPGRIVIDATNNFAGPVVSNVPLIEEHAPKAFVFRAFNALGWEIFADPELGQDTADLFYCGPDGSEKSAMESLIQQVGLRPIWVGGREALEIVDRLGSLWVTLAFRRGMGRRLALKLLED